MSICNACIYSCIDLPPGEKTIVFISSNVRAVQLNLIGRYEAQIFNPLEVWFKSLHEPTSANPYESMYLPPGL